uniref:Uncharacterized protein n=1 Tax=Pithovirus LCPAC403 TaxID=2506596 RepID=A0A481ZBR1_9VIRU|nr:MAG: hypothetical protein LCPAC403_03610 [Pithovirus LCPAC403]
MKKEDHQDVKVKEDQGDVRDQKENKVAREKEVNQVEMENAESSGNAVIKENVVPVVKTVVKVHVDLEDLLD